MGILRDLTSSERRRPSTPPSGAQPASAAVAQSAVAPQPAPSEPPRSELQRRRDTLAEQVTEMHWDLGGLAYEMAIRDHFRLDVLVRRAAQLQERDAELAEVERLLRMEQDGVAGSCPSCAAPHSRGALYCWQCGIALMRRQAADADGVGEGAESVMDALLAQQVAPGSAPAASADE
jgi:hypothetical protein